ncbi:calcium-binding protein [Pseudoduganella lutea]|uniref:Calcium-binding protein n=1 Tax=Pseudoduganella lutea TaxID=321985 RepID=A0A4P6KWP1_9BURK|nr:calcium-binding protein [Pseudoduganella lutea]QBE63356.1 hypothetical protein EWM63_10605 [Pseudoduganella lutea]
MEIFGTRNNDTLIGTDGNDTISGFDGLDSIRGGAGNDQIRFHPWVTDLTGTVVAQGDAGDDEFIFGEYDTRAFRLSGGEGVDTFRLHWFTSAIEILDFKAGAGGDRIDTSTYIERFYWNFNGINPMGGTAPLLRLVQRGADTLLQYDYDSAAMPNFVTVVTLKNVQVTQLTVANFLEADPSGAQVAGKLITQAGADGKWNSGYYADTIIGSERGDWITGSLGDDYLEGNGGDDSLKGDAGNDTLRGGDGNDQLEATGGHDELYGGAGNDSIVNYYGSHLLDGGEGNDSFSLNYSIRDTTLRGGDGNDRVSGVASNEEALLLVDLGAGDDFVKLYVNHAQLVITGGSGVDSYELMIGSDNGSGSATITDFAAGAGGDRLVLRDYIQRIHGRPDYEAGNPFDAQLGYLRAVQEGADTLVQYDADGAALGDRGWETIARLQTVDAAQLTAHNMGDPLGYAPGGGMPAGQLLTAVYNIDLYGGHGDDTLQGTGNSDELNGGAGNDVLYSGDAESRYLERGDEMDGDIGNDTVIGGGNNDTLDGGRGNDDLDGGGNNDSIEGEDGDDIIRVSAGEDSIAGGDGIDTVYFGNNFADYRIERVHAGIALHDDVRGVHAFLYSVETLVFADATRAFADLMRVSGTAGNDALLGSAFGDTIDGGQGNDTMTGLGGYDEYVVDSAGDRIVEEAGGGVDTIHLTTSLGNYRIPDEVERLVLEIGDAAIDVVGNGSDNTIDGTDAVNAIDGGAGNDTLSGAGGNDGLQGEAGDDDLDGGSGNDTLLGGAGDDELSGDGGIDSMVGGTGDDIYVIDVVADIVVETANGGVDRIYTWLESFVLPENFETLGYWGDAAFHGTGNAADNTLYGYGNNDTLDGAAGADTMDGAWGDDLYLVDNVGDTVEESSNWGFDTVMIGLAGAGTWRMGDHVERAIVTGSLAVNVTGGDTENELRGNGAANILVGHGGDDTLNGGGGSDTLDGGYGDDIFIVDAAGDMVIEMYDQGTDRVVTTLGNYALSEHLEDLAYAGSASFAGKGNAAANLLTGGAGNDTLAGGAGKDTLAGMAGNDTLDGGAGEDRAWVGGAFADYTRKREGGDTVLVHASTGDRTVLRDIEWVQFADGTRPIDALQDGIIGNGADVLNGTAGADRLDGDGGADTMAGGAGNDTYVVDVAGDVIVEAADAGRDMVEVGLGNGTYTLAANVEDATIMSSGAAGITGNDLANALTGNGAANALTGGAGNDTLDGGKGNDALAGGSGDDVYHVDATGDKVTESADGGTDTVITTLAKYTLGANVENVTYTGTGAFAAAGNALGNVIVGGKGNDTVDGAAGIDTYVATGAFGEYSRQRPNATDLVLIKGDQTITLKNVETVRFSDGVKTQAELFVNVASVANDTLSGTDGNDSMNGLAGADQMSGGLGNDLYVVDNIGDRIVENAGAGRDSVQVALARGTYVLAANVEDAVVTSTGAVGITGNDLANELAGNGAANALSGGGGNDTLDGGKGSDALVGGTGDDTYVVDAAGDKVTELADQGTDTVSTTLVKYTLGAHLENLAYTGTSAFAGTGNALDNVITAGVGNDTIDGAAGTDRYVIQGDLADFQRQSPSDKDLVLVKGTQKITLRNIEEVEFSDGVKSIDQLRVNVASQGNDTLTGTAGDDEMNGLAGADQLTGGKGDDTYFLDNVDDTVVELANQGIDTVNIGISAKITYTLGEHIEHAAIMSTAAINIIGNTEDNTLTGNAAANALTGGAGNDTLIGGKGNDTLDGGAGNDFYSVDATGDKVQEEANGGYDIVETTVAKTTLAANVEELRFTGKGAFTGIGNNLDNVIIGGAGSDKLTGGLGADTFVIGAGNDTITDFASGTDHLVIARKIGDGDLIIEQVATPGAAGSFSSKAELVLFTQNVTSLSATNAAKAIGSATEAYGLGDTALFALHTAGTTAVYLFTSSGNDAVVSKGELQQIATLTGVPSLGIGDFQMGDMG